MSKLAKCVTGVQGASFGLEKAFVDIKVGSSVYQMGSRAATVTAHHPAKHTNIQQSFPNKKLSQSSGDDDDLMMVMMSMMSMDCDDDDDAKYYCDDDDNF